MMTVHNWFMIGQNEKSSRPNWTELLHELQKIYPIFHQFQDPLDSIWDIATQPDYAAHCM
jgi:hypothetical protein